MVIGTAGWVGTPNTGNPSTSYEDQSTSDQDEPSGWTGNTPSQWQGATFTNINGTPYTGDTTVTASGQIESNWTVGSNFNSTATVGNGCH
jgi:hypothetical protein